MKERIQTIALPWLAIIMLLAASSCGRSNGPYPDLSPPSTNAPEHRDLPPNVPSWPGADVRNSGCYDVHGNRHC